MNITIEIDDKDIVNLVKTYEDKITDLDTEKAAIINKINKLKSKLNEAKNRVDDTVKPKPWSEDIPLTAPTNRR